jgi:hypothetical protein
MAGQLNVLPNGQDALGTLSPTTFFFGPFYVNGIANHFQ